MRLSRIVAALAAVIPGLCVADPVTIIAIGSQLAASGALGAALTISASTAAWIGVGAAVYGMAKARQDQRKMAAEARARQVASLEDRSYRALTNLPPIETVYGQVNKAGYIVDNFATDLTSTGADGITRTFPDGLRHLVIVWAAHECQGLDELIFGQESIGTSLVDAQGWALPGTVFNRSQSATRTNTIPAGTSVLPAVAAQILSCVGIDHRDQVAYTLAPDGQTITASGACRVTWTTSLSIPMLRMSHHLGAASQPVDSYLAAIAPSRYTSAHRLAGLCYSVLTFDLRFERWQSEPPPPVAQIRGKRLYDPRTGLTLHSANAALCVYDYLTHSDGMAVDPVDISMASVIAAANACDEYITLDVGGGTVSTPRYTCNGTWETGAAREGVLDNLCRSMAGSATYSGQWTISAGIYTPHVMTLTDNDLAGSISIVQAGAPDEQISNSVRGVYVPRGTLTAVDMEPYSNAALVTADGGELWESIDFPFTDRSWLCRQIARITIETRRNGLVISYPAKAHAVRLQPGDRVNVTSAEYGWTSKTFRVTDAQLAPRQSVVLTLQEDAPEAWDAVDTNEADPTPNVGIPSPWGVIAPITGLAAVSGSSVLQIAGDGTIITRVRVSWDLPSAPYAAGVTITWEPVGGTATSINVPADQTSIDIAGPVDGQMLTIAAYVRTMTGTSDGRYIAHQVLGKTEPPPPVEALAMQELPELGRVVSWSYPAPPLDLGGFVARYSVHSTPTAAWSAQADLFAASAGARTFTATSAPPDGDWDITVRAIDTTGNLSTPVTINVLMAQGGLGTPIMTVKPEALGWPGTKTNCIVDGSFLAQSDTPWDSLPTTWDAWTVWSTSAESISYVHQIDLGAPANVRIRADAVSNAITTLDLQHSSNGTDWSAWEPIPEGHVNAHYLRVRATVTGSALAYLYNMTINIYT